MLVCIRAEKSCTRAGFVRSPGQQRYSDCARHHGTTYSTQPVLHTQNHAHRITTYIYPSSYHRKQNAYLYMMTNPWTRRWRFDNGIGLDIDNYIGR